MKERPILFSGAMVRALLDGSKTQTRRIVKWHGLRPGLNLRFSGLTASAVGQRWVLESPTSSSHEWRCEPTPCPYGALGDRLYVRETHEVNRIGYEEDGGGLRRHHAGVAYKADGGREQFPISVFQYEAFDAKESAGWTPSIHMPRWASRITLEVTGVRVERLREISEADAKAEGTMPSIVGADLDYLKYRAGYQTLWDDLNAARGHGWDVNPWVWVIEFKRVMS